MEKKGIRDALSRPHGAVPVVPASCSRPRIRWMVVRDTEAVLRIERASFDFPWSAGELAAVLWDLRVTAKVAEHGGCVAGFVIYRSRERTVEVLDLAVHPGCRRAGVGRSLLAHTAEKLTRQGRKQLVAWVNELNLEAQLFFAACGFRATSIRRDYFETQNGDPIDGYRFVLRKGA